MFYLTIFFLFSLGQLGRISFFNQQINIYFYEIFLAAHLVYLLFKFKLQPLFQIKHKIYWTYIFLIWTIIGYTLLIPFYLTFTNIIACLYLLRLSVYIFWGIYYCFYLNKNPKEKKNILKWIIFPIILNLILSLGQFIKYPDLFQLKYMGWDMHFNRLFGLYFDTSIAGGVLGVFIWILIFLQGKIKNIWLKYGSVFLAVICGVLTFSRNFYVSFFVSLIIFIIVKKNWKILAVLILFSATLVIVPKRFGQGVGLLRVFSIESRLKEYSQAIDLWKKNPILGIGYNRVRYLKESNNLLNNKSKIPVHSASSFSSSFTNILVTTGIIGLILLILSLAQLSMLNNYILVVFVFVTTMSLGDNILLHPYILFLLSGSISLFDK